MLLAIVGSTSLAGNHEAESIIGKVIQKYKPEAVVSGGAVGIDTMAADIAKTRFNLPVIECQPAGQSWLYFEPRNRLIARICDRLVRIVVKDSKTFGSGFTKLHAEHLGKPTEEYVIG